MGTLIAIIGVYGMVATAVRQRTREVGVRIALGAPRHAVLRTVLSETVLTSSAGLLIGCGALYTLMRLFGRRIFGITGAIKSGVLFNSSPIDPQVLALTILSMTAVVLLASIVPALRALAVSPSEALRGD